MPAQSDAENALVQLAAAALYPNGVDAASVIPATIRLYRGWPNATALDADLAAGRVNVTVFPVPGATRNTTRYSPDWLPDPAAAPRRPLPAPHIRASLPVCLLTQCPTVTARPPVTRPPSSPRR